MHDFYHERHRAATSTAVASLLVQHSCATTELATANSRVVLVLLMLLCCGLSYMSVLIPVLLYCYCCMYATTSSRAVTLIYSSMVDGNIRTV